MILKELVVLVPLYLVLTSIVTSLIVLARPPQADAAEWAFVTLESTGGRTVTGISANIQTPTYNSPPDQLHAYWVGVEFGDESNPQFIQVGLANHVVFGVLTQKVFWAVGGPYENSGNPVICYFQGLARSCPVAINVDSIILQPGSVHNYAIRHTNGQWQFLVDGYVVHALNDHGHRVSFKAYYATESQWGLPWRFINQAETIQSPIVTLSNVLVTFVDGSQKPLLTTQYGVRIGYSPSNNANGFEVNCSNLTVKTGGGLGHPTDVSCYVAPPIDFFPTSSDFPEEFIYLFVFGAMIFFVVALIRRFRR